MRADAVVVGLGGFGSMTLWRLARRGLDVVGVEQYRAGHTFGSSDGATRLFRLACLEHPGLVPLAEESRRLWRELERETGTDLLHKSGGLMVGPETGRAIAGTRAAARSAGLSLTELDIGELRSRYPQHAGLGDHYVGLWDAEAGILRPEAAVLTALSTARRAGARVLDGVSVEAIQPDTTGVRVVTPTGVIEADQVVVTAGPWLTKLVPDLYTQPRRVPQLWFESRDDPEAFTLGRFPVFIRHYDDEHTIWGHGATLGEPTKVGLSLRPENLHPVDPDTMERGVSPSTDWELLASVLEKAIPGLDPTPAKARPCMVTDSADQQFLVGRLARSERVVVAGGCSGHGFKHASGVGEAVARGVLGEEPFADLTFLDPNRS
ncbi:MAG: N-methyl-L-tryptophan oxidase [Pseudonocardiaceae bacterium]|nr:N-methyl-L-tryptophan oxidase [Pseudonocardiaceae bacterium]